MRVDLTFLSETQGRKDEQRRELRKSEVLRTGMVVAALVGHALLYFRVDSRYDSSLPSRPTVGVLNANAIRESC